MLKELATTTAPILTVIFKQSCDTGDVPDEWRTANVIPIHPPSYQWKDRRTKLVTTYQSHLHVFSANCLSISSTVSSWDTLTHTTYCVTSMRSCETQLLEFVANTANTMQKGAQTDILIIVLSKAFDKVGHTRLVRKLDHYGIRGKTNRKQTVALERERSDKSPVISGVPQGSVLGPSSFSSTSTTFPTT